MAGGHWSCHQKAVSRQLSAVSSESGPKIDLIVRIRTIKCKTPETDPGDFVREAPKST
jgi:hypothetical protein